MAITHRGARYAVGTAGDTYALWDAVAQGAPLRQWPLSPEGWKDAWAEFVRLDGPTGLPAAGRVPASAVTANPWALASLLVGVVGALFVFAPVRDYIFPIIAGVVGLILAFVARRQPGGETFVLLGTMASMSSLGVGVFGFFEMQQLVQELNDQIRNLPTFPGL